jgi:chromosomal replication initiation ATPase DnaA
MNRLIKVLDYCGFFKKGIISAMNVKELWDKSLAEIELSMSKANFTTWFKHTSIVREEAGAIYIGVPNEFVKDWLYNKFHKLIVKTLIGHEEGIRSVEYIISKYEPNAKLEVRDIPQQTIQIN